MAVCCQNLRLGAFSSLSAPSMLVGALFKKFGPFLNTFLTHKHTPHDTHIQTHTHTTYIHTYTHTHHPLTHKHTTHTQTYTHHTHTHTTHTHHRHTHTSHTLTTHIHIHYTHTPHTHTQHTTMLRERDIHYWHVGVNASGQLQYTLSVSTL